MLTYVKKILALLTPAEQKQGFILLGMMILLAFMEVGGIASIAPFLYVLGNPDVIEGNGIVRELYYFSGAGDHFTFLVVLGVGSFLFLLCSAGYRSLVFYMTTRFANMQRHSISSRLLAQYLRQPYAYFLKSNSSEMSKKILSETDHVIGQAIVPLLNAATSSLVLAAIIVLLFIMDPLLACVAGLFFGGIYIGLYVSVRRYLVYMGGDVKEANSLRFKIANELLKGIKELKVLGREKGYLGTFYGPSRRYSRHQAVQKVIMRIPEFFVEVLAFGTLLIIALFAMKSDTAKFGELLPSLGLYGFSAFKVKPIMQVLFSAFSQMRFGDAILDDVLKDLHQAPLLRGEGVCNTRVKLKDSIALEGVSFHYSGKEVDALSDICLEFHSGSCTGIVGTTGAGKSTLVDLILGLIHPTKGAILLDGKELEDDTARAWQNNIGYVPQHIFLADDSIERNIAFGVADREIDHEGVRNAARVAQIHTYIEKQDNGYQTIIGENGVRLSGGERQRIGIARALYHDPDVLILDEATSALDNETEQNFVNDMAIFGKNKTVIMIAHRLSSLRYCDRIVELKEGRIVEGNSRLQE